jgi:glyoxylase-like metal-dependent hydrolase (beta-lactamase superfamily II)
MPTWGARDRPSGIRTAPLAEKRIWSIDWHICLAMQDGRLPAGRTRWKAVMKIFPKWIVLLASVTLWVGFGIPAHASGDIVLTPTKVSDHVYYFHGQSGMASAANQGFMSNAGFVVTHDGVIVFDALGTPALGKAMLAAIGTITSRPVTRVIVSHYHADHYYGLQAFHDKGIEIWAHENGRNDLRSEAAQQRLAERKKDLFPWVDNRTRLVGADRWLSFANGKTIRFESGGLHFRIIDSSGAHSPDDIMLFVEEDRVLFAGDLFFSGRIPFVGNADSKAWLAAMDQMLQVQPRVVIPGHGAASDHPQESMQLTRDYLTYLRQVMGRAADDMTNFDQAYQQVDWSRFAKYPSFEQANRLNAYGTYLLMEQETLDRK